MDLRTALKMLLTLPLVTILCVGAAESSYKLTVLHTNDVHSRFDEAHKYGGLCSAEDAANGDCVGGVSRRYVMSLCERYNMKQWFRNRMICCPSQCDRVETSL